MNIKYTQQKKIKSINLRLKAEKINQKNNKTYQKFYTLVKSLIQIMYPIQKEKKYIFLSIAYFTLVKIEKFKIYIE